MKIRIYILMVGLLSAVSIYSLYACSTPVYRYALERWPPDYYRATIFHKGALSDDQSALLDAFRKRVDSESPTVNLAVRTVDVDKPLDEHASQLMDTVSEKERSYPFVALQYPYRGPTDKCIKTQPFTKEDLDILLDSPVRARVSSSILDDRVAVWILLLSGNKELDAAAEKIIKEYMDVPAGPTEELVEGSDEPKRLQFGLEKISRDDVAEKPFIEMLLNSEPDLKEFKEPIAFVIFGRGRALYALVGKGINKQNIEETLYFLTGPCACEIKAQNPGTDMLMLADWDKVLMDSMIIEEELPPLTSVTLPEPVEESEPAEVAPPVVKEAAPADVSLPVDESSPERGLMIPVLAVVGAMVLVVLAGSMIMKKS